MYVTVAELNLLLLRRQLEQAKAKHRWARERGWEQAITNWKRMVHHLAHRVARQEDYVKRDLANRNAAKSRWLDRLA